MTQSTPTRGDLNVPQEAIVGKGEDPNGSGRLKSSAAGLATRFHRQMGDDGATRRTMVVPAPPSPTQSPSPESRALREAKMADGWWWLGKFFSTLLAHSLTGGQDGSRRRDAAMMRAASLCLSKVPAPLPLKERCRWGSDEDRGGPITPFARSFAVP